MRRQGREIVKGAVIAVVLGLAIIAIGKSGFGMPKQKVKTTNMGTLFELHYDVIMKKDVSEKEFIDSILCRNGDLNIQLGVKESNTQQL
jgi:hypothetical protein